MASTRTDTRGALAVKDLYSGVRNTLVMRRPAVVSACVSDQ